MRHMFSASLGLLAAMLASVAPAGAQTQWNLPTAYVQDNPHTQNILKFTEEVAAATDGKLQIRVFPNGSLFKGAEIKRVVATGQAQMGEVLMALHENEDPVWGVDTVPFLATSFEQGRKLWEAQRPVIAKILDEQGLIPLFAVPWGPNGIFSNRPITRIEDMNGMKWRVYNYGTARIGEMIGAQPVSIAAADIPQALATGMIDGFMTAGQAGYDYKVWETLSHYYDIQAWVPKNVTVMNKNAFEKLDKPTQDAIMAAAKAAEDRGWQMSEEGTAWYIEQLSANGMEVGLASEAVTAEFQKMGDIMRQEWLDKAGPEGTALLDSYSKQ